MNEPCNCRDKYSSHLLIRRCHVHAEGVRRHISSVVTLEGLRIYNTSLVSAFGSGACLAAAVRGLTSLRTLQMAVAEPVTKRAMCQISLLRSLQDLELPAIHVGHLSTDIITRKLSRMCCRAECLIAELADCQEEYECWNRQE